MRCARPFMAWSCHMGHFVGTLPSPKGWSIPGIGNAVLSLHGVTSPCYRTVYKRLGIACNVAQRGLGKKAAGLQSTSSRRSSGSVDAHEFLEQVRSCINVSRVSVPATCHQYMKEL